MAPWIFPFKPRSRNLARDKSGVSTSSTNLTLERSYYCDCSYFPLSKQNVIS